MNKQPRLFPVFVALSFFLASSPLPAAAQPIRAQVGVGSGVSVPVVPAIGNGIAPGAGSTLSALTPLGRNALFVAPAPLVSIVQAASLRDNAITVRTPGAASTHIAEEAAAYASPAANTPAAMAVAPVRKGLAGRALDALLNRPAASVSFDGAAEQTGVGPQLAQKQEVVTVLDAIDALTLEEGRTPLSTPKLKALESKLDWLVKNDFPAGMNDHIAGVALACKELMLRGPAGRPVAGVIKAADRLLKKVGWSQKSAPIVARMGLKKLEPLALPNGSATDEQPTVPSPEREPTTSFETYALPNSRDLGGIFETGRKVLSADPSNTAAVVTAVKSMIDADPARYGVASADLRLLGATRFDGFGEQGDAVFIYFRQIKNGLTVNGSALSITVKVIDDKPTVVAQTGTIFPQIDVNTGTPLSDDQIMDKIAERIGVPVSDVTGAFKFFEEKIVYARGEWRQVKLYATDDLPVLIAVDVYTGLVFVWDTRKGLIEIETSAAGSVNGNAVDKGPVLPNSKVDEVALPFLEIKIGGKNYVTDKDGKFAVDVGIDAGIDAGPEGLELTATLTGPYVRVENQQGATMAVKVKIKSGDNKVVFNPGTTAADEHLLSQIGAFRGVNLILAFLRSLGLTTERMDKVQLPVRVNGNGSGNAWYTPGNPTLNFLLASAQFVNSAYDTVFDHEAGHFWDDFTPGGIVNGGLSEAWGDIASMFFLNNPVIGEHFLKEARDGVDYIRVGDDRNTYKYNEYDEEHDQGQAFGGFAWKLRAMLIAKLGYEAGDAMAKALIMPTMFAKAADIPAAMAQVLVNALSKEGTIMHEAEIRAAAKIHGVNLPQAAPAPAQSLLAVSNQRNDAGMTGVTATAGAELPVSLATFLARLRSDSEKAGGKTMGLDWGRYSISDVQSISVVSGVLYVNGQEIGRMYDETGARALRDYLEDNPGQSITVGLEVEFLNTTFSIQKIRLLPSA